MFASEVSLDRSYYAAFAASVILHLAVFSVIGVNWGTKQEQRTIVPVSFVKATLMQLEERTSQPQQQVVPPPSRDLEQERLAEQKRLQELRRQEEAKTLEAQKQKELDEQKRLAEEKRLQEQRAAEQKRLDELERLERLAQEELARRQQAEAQAAEQAAQQASEALSASEEVASYSGTMRSLVEQNWSRPASARNGMTAVLRVNLVPTGSLVSVSIVQSSGDAAFDRAAIQAVRKAEPFEFIQELPIAVFEQNFRQFNFEFNPQDLRL